MHQEDPPVALFVSVLEAARRLGIGKTLLYTQINVGKFPQRRIGGRIVVSVKVLEQLAEPDETSPLLAYSRDTINRLERVGLLKGDGVTSRQCRANGRSVRRLLAHIQEGESLIGSASHRQSRAKRTRTYAESSVYYDRDRRQRCYQQPAIDKQRQPRHYFGDGDAGKHTASWLQRIG